MRQTRQEHFSGTFNVSPPICAYCGQIMRKKREWQRFCSTDCRKESWKAGRIAPAQIRSMLRRLDRIERALNIKSNEEE